MIKRILLTGATGTVGSPLARMLVEKGHAVRALVRNPEKAAAPREAGAELVTGSFDDAASLRAAFEGIDTAFLLVPPSPDAAKWNRALYAAAKASGAPHVVRLSVINAAVDGPTDNTKLHGESDRDLLASGLPYTLVRPHFFMQNLLGSAASIAKDGAFYLGMGQGKLGMIDTRDITESAFAVLDGPRAAHAGKAYDLTGPASITFDEVASTLGKVLGTPVEIRGRPAGGGRPGDARDGRERVVRERHGPVLACLRLELGRRRHGRRQGGHGPRAALVRDVRARGARAAHRGGASYLTPPLGRFSGARSGFFQ